MTEQTEAFAAAVAKADAALIDALEVSDTLEQRVLISDVRDRFLIGLRELGESTNGA